MGVLHMINGVLDSKEQEILDLNRMVLLNKQMEFLLSGNTDQLDDESIAELILYGEFKNINTK